MLGGGGEVWIVVGSVGLRCVAVRVLAKRLGGDRGFAVAVAAGPAPDAQEWRGTRDELLLLPRIKFGHHGQEDIAQIGQRIVDLVGDEQFLGAQRTRLPKENHLPARSAEHTSELQSLMRISYAAVCSKKKKHR